MKYVHISWTNDHVLYQFFKFIHFIGKYDNEERSRVIKGTTRY